MKKLNLKVIYMLPEFSGYSANFPQAMGVASDVRNVIWNQIEFSVREQLMFDKSI